MHYAKGDWSGKDKSGQAYKGTIGNKLTIALDHAAINTAGRLQ
jgi:hypothetical protein